MCQGVHIGGNAANLFAIEHLVTAEGRHLRDPALGMRGVDADTHRLLDEFGTAAPQPVIVCEVGVVGAAPAVAAVARSAVVTEQLPPCVAHGPHQRLVGEDRVIGLVLQPCRPARALLLAVDDPGFDRRLLVYTQKPLRIGHAKRPGRHHKPPEDRPDVGDDQEHQHPARDRRIQFLDAVPFVARRLAPGDGVAFYVRHGVSSRSRMLCLARSNCFLFLGKKA